MTARFLGLDFAPVGLEHKPVLQDYLRRFPQRISGYTFASLVAWARPFGFEWARLGEDCVLISRPGGAGGERHLLQPIGVMNAGCCETLLGEARRLPYALKLLDVTTDFLALHAGFVGHFTVEEERAHANYIYLARELAELRGRRYARKRNLILQFAELYPDWEAAALDARCGPGCVDILLAVARGSGIGEDDPSLRAELQALDFTMRNFEALEQKGLMIRVHGQPAAFSVFEKLHVETAAVHFEKADREYKGLYQVINRETARMVAAAGCHLINREEDLGDPGLRKAKLSYHPLDIYPVYDLTLMRAD